MNHRPARSIRFYLEQLGFELDFRPHSSAPSTSTPAAGAPFSVPLRTMPYGGEFYVRDPDGYIIGFVQPAT